MCQARAGCLAPTLSPRAALQSRGDACSHFTERNYFYSHLPKLRGADRRLCGQWLVQSGLLSQAASGPRSRSPESPSSRSVPIDLLVPGMVATPEAALPVASALIVEASMVAPQQPEKVLSPPFHIGRRCVHSCVRGKPQPSAGVLWKVLGFVPCAQVTGHFLKGPVGPEQAGRQERSADLPQKGLPSVSSSLVSGRTLTRTGSEMRLPGASHSNQFIRWNKWPSSW